MLGPPPAGPPAASQSGWSLSVSAGAAARCFSPRSSSCWQFLMTAHSAETSGLWQACTCPEWGKYWTPWITNLQINMFDFVLK